MIAVRALTVVVGLALGALFAVGCLVAMHFELSGFGDRDGEPSTLYLLVLGLGLLGSIGLPLVIWRALLPRSFSPTAAVAAGAVAVLGTVWILGIAVTG